MCFRSLERVACVSFRSFCLLIFLFLTTSFVAKLKVPNIAIGKERKKKSKTMHVDDLLGLLLERDLIEASSINDGQGVASKKSTSTTQLLVGLPWMTPVTVRAFIHAYNENIIILGLAL